MQESQRMNWNFMESIKQKLSDELWERIKDREDGKLVLVTAINPTPAERERQRLPLVLDRRLQSLAKNQ